ncbi:MAG: cytidylate kinase-like family protein [Lachnospiraceae bacterium]|nr:cytidylate kinase-like family protein [Lachnospiraceae bacterium]
MSKNIIITIGRELGSGGREIGKIVAEKLDIAYYDKELLSIVAKESGFCEEFIEQHEEAPTKSFIYSLVMGMSGYANGTAYNNIPLEQKVFLAQFDAIKKLADEQSCVIVGRCADYALEEKENVFSVFIHAPKEYRVAKVAANNNISVNEATDIVNKTDKKRASYYNYYTNKKWGASASYNMCIDGSILDKEQIADIIVDVAKKYFNI